MTASSRPSLQALPDWSAVPSDSEEDRKLVNQRIAFFAAIVGGLSAIFYVSFRSWASSSIRAGGSS